MNWELSQLGLTERVMLGTALLGGVAGVVGSFAVLRRRALVGDMLAHAALPGICFAFLIMGTRNLLGLSFGALVSGVLGIAVVTFVCAWTRTKEDAAIGIVLSTFFGTGVVLLSLTQRLGNGHQAGLDSYIFGETATIQTRDLTLLIVIAAVSLLIVTLFYKEFQILSFDSEFAESQGWPVLRLDLGMMSLLAVVTILGLPIVGIVLMSAMIVIPAATARFWTHSLGRLLVIAGFTGAAAGIVGTLLASPLPTRWLGFDPLAFGYNRRNLPPGPLIVLSAAGFFLFSLLFAPRQGVIARAWTEFQLRRRILREHVLRSLYEITEPELPELTPVHESQLLGYRRWNRFLVLWFLRKAVNSGLVTRLNDHVQLTQAGLLQAAELAKRHRMWELYLVEHANIAADHVDRDADEVEHLLPETLLADLEKKMVDAGRLPQVTDRVPKSPHSMPDPPPPPPHQAAPSTGPHPPDDGVSPGAGR